MNLPGWLFSSAILTFSFQIVPATCGAHERLDGGPARQREQVQKDLVLLLRGVGFLENERLRLRHLADRRAGRVRFLGDAHVLGVIGHPHEVHGRVDLDVVAHRMLDGLALRVLQSLARPGHAIAHHPGIHRPTRVDVLLAEVSVAIGIFLNPLFGGSRGARLLCLFWLGRLRLLARGEGEQCNENQSTAWNGRNSLLIVLSPRSMNRVTAQRIRDRRTTHAKRAYC